MLKTLKEISFIWRCYKL